MVHSHIKHGQSFPMMETLRSLTNAVIRISEAEKSRFKVMTALKEKSYNRVHQGPVQESCKATLAKPHWIFVAVFWSSSVGWARNLYAKIPVQGPRFNSAPGHFMCINPSALSSCHSKKKYFKQISARIKQNGFTLIKVNQAVNNQKCFWVATS